MVRRPVCLASLAAVVTLYWMVRAGVEESTDHTRMGPAAAHAQVVGGSAPVIYDNLTVGGGVNPNGNAPASQRDAEFPFDAGAVDDFILPQSPLCRWSVEGVRFQGVYWNEDGPGAISAFRVIFWPDTTEGPAGQANGTPDLAKAAMILEIPGDGGETASSTAGTFAYELVLPESLEVSPHQRWWIQIQAAIPYPPQWGLAITNARQGAAPQRYFDLLELPAWTPIDDSGDLAFQLLGAPKAIACDDGNACTADSCDASGGCVQAAIVCDDQNACTTDSCDASTGCTTAPVVCNDGDACTTDSCEPSSGCRFAPMECDDGEACTVDACSDGACRSIAPPDFDADGRIGVQDAAVMILCIAAGGGEGCGCTDLTGDGATDLRDFSTVQRLFTGGE